MKSSFYHLHSEFTFVMLTQSKLRCDYCRLLLHFYSFYRIAFSFDYTGSEVEPLANRGLHLSSLTGWYDWEN